MSYSVAIVCSISPGIHAGIVARASGTFMMRRGRCKRDAGTTLPRQTANTSATQNKIGKKKAPPLA
jgi:hypothetical protein